jgi:hypothetical protein
VEKRKRIRTAGRWLWEFSKRVVVIMAALYFISFIYAMVCCYIAVELAADTTALATLIAETNETFRVVVGGYMIKAGVENATKILRNSREDGYDEPQG